MKVIKIGAEWCPGCIIMRPRWTEIEKELPWLETEYYDFDKDQDKIGKYTPGETLPVFIFLDNQENEITRLQGEPSKKEILNLIKNNKNK